MNVGDAIVVRYGDIPSKVRPRVAMVASLEPLGIRLAAGPYGGAPAKGKSEFRPRWMRTVHQVAPEAVVRPATRRELVLGHPDPTIGVAP